MHSGERRKRQGDGAAHDHVVEFYDSEKFLVGTVAGFIGPALNGGDAAIVVATSPHREAFEAALGAAGIDLVAAVAEDRYLAFDATERLGSFMVEGAPDAGRFAEMVAGVVDRAAAGGRRVRIYGEMVAVLWDAGEVAAAVALEDLWSDFANQRAFSLLCAYPMQSFDDHHSAAAFERICDQHSTVIPTEEYALVGGDHAQQRAVAKLQQQATALKADVMRLRAERVAGQLAQVEGLRARVGTTGPERGLWRSPLRGTVYGTTALAPVRPPPVSPGGRVLAESLATLSSRLRYSK